MRKTRIRALIGKTNYAKRRGIIMSLPERKVVSIRTFRSGPVIQLIDSLSPEGDHISLTVCKLSLGSLKEKFSNKVGHYFLGVLFGRLLRDRGLVPGGASCIFYLPNFHRLGRIHHCVQGVIDGFADPSAFRHQSEDLQVSEKFPEVSVRYTELIDSYLSNND